MRESLRDALIGAYIDMLLAQAPQAAPWLRPSLLDRIERALAAREPVRRIAHRRYRGRRVRVSSVGL